MGCNQQLWRRRRHCKRFMDVGHRVGSTSLDRLASMRYRVSDVSARETALCLPIGRNELAAAQRQGVKGLRCRAF